MIRSFKKDEPLIPRPIPFLPPGTTRGDQILLRGRLQRAASHQGKQGQGVLLHAPVPGPFPPRGQQEVRRKGRDGRREWVGRNGVYQIPSRLPRGQQLAQGIWLERLFSERREAARPTRPTDSHSGEPRVHHIKLIRAAINALTPAVLSSFQACGRERGWRLEAGFRS